MQVETTCWTASYFNCGSIWQTSLLLDIILMVACSIIVCFLIISCVNWSREWVQTQCTSPVHIHAMPVGVIHTYIQHGLVWYNMVWYGLAWFITYIIGMMILFEIYWHNNILHRRERLREELKAELLREQRERVNQADFGDSLLQTKTEILQQQPIQNLPHTELSIPDGPSQTNTQTSRVMATPSSQIVCAIFNLANSADLILFLFHAALYGKTKEAIIEKFQ